jgi:hypothetical protein
MGASASKSLEERIRERAAAVHRPTLLQWLMANPAKVGVGAGVVLPVVVSLIALWVRRLHNRRLQAAPPSLADTSVQAPPVWPTKLDEVTCRWLDTVVPGAADAGGIRAFEASHVQQAGYSDDDMAPSVIQLTLSYCDSHGATPLPQLGLSVSQDELFDVIVCGAPLEFTKSGSVGSDSSQFAARHGAAPTYGDVLWSAALEDPAKYIVHALPPDLSEGSAWERSGLGRAETFAALVASNFRALWQATVIAGPDCKICIPALGIGGTSANEPDDICKATVLAHAAYRLTGARPCEESRHRARQLETT